MGRRSALFVWIHITTLCASLVLGEWTTTSAASEAIEIGSRRELLVDRHVVEQFKGAFLQLHAPKYAGVALTCDAPWEGPFSGYFTILEDGATCRMYYRGLPVLADNTDAECTCYAESKDGIVWVKPKLGLFEVRGSKDNNVVLHGQIAASHNFAPFIDTRAGVPAEEKFKAICGSQKTGLMAYVSADGIQWRRLGDKPLITDGAFDSQNVAFWSESEKCYVCYFRVYTDVRSIARATSLDFTSWSKPEVIDFGDTPHEHFYTNQTFAYPRAPQIYIALAMRFFENRSSLDAQQFKQLGVDPDYVPFASHECSDGVFMTSRGANRFDRTFLEAFVRPGLDSGNWVSRSVMAARGILQTSPQELSLFYEQHDGQKTKHLARYTLRTDGFASVRAPYAGGELITKPIRFDGQELEINFSTSAAGSIRVELLDDTGNPIPGFSLTDCPEIIGDSVERIVSWQAGSDVSRLAGKPVRLRFVMRDADLYSFRFKAVAAPEAR